MFSTYISHISLFVFQTKRGRPRCNCKDGFHGDKCEHRHVQPCEDIRCQNGGTCELGRHGLLCVCSSLYTGSRCESVMDPCVSHPCKHGRLTEVSIIYMAWSFHADILSHEVTCITSNHSNMKYQQRLLVYMLWISVIRVYE